MKLREFLDKCLCKPISVPKGMSRYGADNDTQFAGTSMADLGLKRAKGMISRFDENGRMDNYGV